MKAISVNSYYTQYDRMWLKVKHDKTRNSLCIAICFSRSLEKKANVGNNHRRFISMVRDRLVHTSVVRDRLFHTSMVRDK
jgi:hypothetical protein